MRSLLIRIVPVLLLTFCYASFLEGQQLPHYGQYMFNPYANNPAVAGSEDVSFASLGYRAQWSGLKGAPTTASATFHTDFRDRVGFGGMIFTDENGPFKRSGLRLSYAYQVPLSDQTRLGFGLAGVLYQHSLDQGALNPEVEDDPLLQGSERNSLSPDGIFGTYLNGEKYHVGFSVSHLFESKMFGDEAEKSQLARHYYLGGGYQFELAEKWGFHPSLMTRMTLGAPLNVDLNGKLVYDELVWVGASYRTSGSFLAMIGLRKGQFSVAYAYDMGTAALRQHSNGTHEIQVSMRIPSGEEIQPPSF